MSKTGVLRWGCPVPSFGNLSASRVATVGINPSNREFLDYNGNELEGAARRFHTLSSLGLQSWADVDARHLSLILESCRMYFQGNPYDRWFKALDRVVAGTGASYYGRSSVACHLDLIPYATSDKWTDLTKQQRSSLLVVASDALAFLLRDSPVQIVILNGQSVVNQFEAVAAVRLRRQEMPVWSLKRRSKPDVVGFAYWGGVDSLCGIGLGKKVKVLGYNHNLQSSFGVTSKVICSIRSWISEILNKATV